MAPMLLVGGIIAVSVVGLADALYFLVARPPILENRYGRALGLPNPVLGAAWYLVCLAAGVGLVAAGDLPWCEALVVIAAGTVLFSLFLVWALLFRLQTVCLLCFLGHACNATLLVLLWLACAGQP